MKYPKGWAGLGILVGVVALLCLVVYTANAILFQSGPGKQRGTAPISTTQPAPTPDSYTKMYRAFGPWKVVGNFDISSDRIALVSQDGSKRIGSRLVHPDTSWQKAVVPSLRDIIAAGGYVTVRTTSNGTFSIRINQAFVLDSQPETVYGFTAHGKLVAAPSENFE
jgi:hypothetical protein